MRDDLIRRLEALPDDRGTPMGTRVYRPEELYAEVNGVAPDLIAIFGDLLWRSVATIGGDEGIYTLENDTGPDDANHAQDGMFVAAGAGVEAIGASRPASARHRADRARAARPAGSRRRCAAAAPPALLGGAEARGPMTPNLVVYVSDALRTDHVGCYGARYVATPTIDDFAARRRPLRPGDRRGAVDGPVDGLDDHRPLPAPARLPALGRRARPGVPDAVHGRGRVRLRDGAASSSTSSYLFRGFADANVAGTSERLDGALAWIARAAATRRSASGSTAGRRTCPTTCIHAERRRVARGEGARSSPASSPAAPPRSRRCARATAQAVERQSEVLFASFLERLDDLGLREQHGRRVRRRPRRVVGRALRRQGGGQGHVPHARRRALRRGRRRCR